MTWFITILLLLVGLVLIIKGGDYFVDAASWIAEVSGIPKLIVGATVVSFATTLPELLVSSFAAVKGEVDLCVGNAVGSVIANTGLILGISLVCIPAIIKRKNYLVKSILLIAATIVLTIFCWNTSFGLLGSILLIIIFILAMTENVRTALKEMKSEENIKLRAASKPTRKTVIINILKFVFGITGIIIGADLLVDNGQILATMLGIPSRIIGITILAVGTSLPELVTTITAIVKKQASLSAGNIIGANIIDLSLILPVSAIISGGNLPVSLSSAHVDMPFSFIIVLIALIPTLICKKFSRIQGILMIGLYLCYITLSCMNLLSL